MSRPVVILLSIAAGLALPLLIDWALFGTITPCHTIQQFEDGSSIQRCEVRR